VRLAFRRTLAGAVRSRQPNAPYVLHGSPPKQGPSRASVVSSKLSPRTKEFSSLRLKRRRDTTPDLQDLEPLNLQVRFVLRLPTTVLRSTPAAVRCAALSSTPGWSGSPRPACGAAACRCKSVQEIVVARNDAPACLPAPRSISGWSSTPLGWSVAQPPPRWRNLRQAIERQFC
jgi:hypothetical protein